MTTLQSKGIYRGLQRCGRCRFYWSPLAPAEWCQVSKSLANLLDINPQLVRPHHTMLLLLLQQVILEALDTHLVVFSPYISLAKLLESDPQLADLSQNAWAALNDVYRTDAVIVYAPHVLALGCLYLASVICSRDITAWLEGVEVDINKVK